MPLVGLIEIAMRSGVQRPVVSMWRTRHRDTFPNAVADLAVGPIFWWPDVEEWLRATGRLLPESEWLRREQIKPDKHGFHR